MFFGFVEHQGNCNYGFGYKLTFQRNSDNLVLGHRAGTNAENFVLAGRVIIDDINWYVLHYTPNISNQKLMLGHIVPTTPTVLSYIKRPS